MTERHDEITGICSKCHRSTTAELDPYEQDYMSVCCWRKLVDPSVAVDSAEDAL